jgi:hypothetical protein
VATDVANLDALRRFDSVYDTVRGAPFGKEPTAATR